MGKYAHLPFEDWLLSDEPLQPEQTLALQEHLRTCQDCSQLEASWSGVEQLFRTSIQAEPTPGFSTRWQERLAVQRAHQQRLQTWVLFTTMASVALGLLIMMVTQFAALFRAPSQWLVIEAYIISSLINSMETAQRLFSTGQNFVQSLPLAVVVGFSGFTSLLCVLWIVIYKKLTSAARRIRS